MRRPVGVIVITVLLVLLSCAVTGMAVALLVGRDADEPVPHAVQAGTATTVDASGSGSGSGGVAPSGGGGGTSGATDADGDSAADGNGGDPGDGADDGLIEVPPVVGNSAQSGRIWIREVGLTPVVVPVAPPDPAVCRYDEMPTSHQVAWRQTPEAGHLLPEGAEVRIYSCPPEATDIGIAD